VEVFVTVGMSDWPFDRLIQAVAPVCEHHRVFVQRGCSTVVPPCPHADFVGFAETQRRIAAADVVVTHAGNTVRLVQRAGKVPVVVAREADRGEIRNDHQLRYVDDPGALGPAVVVRGDLSDLATVVDEHPAREREILRTAAPRPADPERAAARLERLTAGAAAGAPGREVDNPFRSDPTRRYAWAWSQVVGSVRAPAAPRRSPAPAAGARPRHLDLGIGEGAPFFDVLRARDDLVVVGADAHPGYLAGARATGATARLVRTEVDGRLPFADAACDSATLLDVLEHVGDEEVTLAELHRVLRPGGLLVLTVPARHALSWMDPDDAKLRFRRAHRAVYTARYGSQRYAQRFVDSGDGLRGDLAWNRTEHTNYRAADLVARLAGHGFDTVARDGANLLGRLLHAARLLAGPLGRPLDRAELADGLVFRSANLFLLAERR
jgi:SAM-dependent methyltransferase/UDP-N-acetylglucosamine transferase subunit ALG13